MKTIAKAHAATKPTHSHHAGVSLFVLGAVCTLIVLALLALLFASKSVLSASALPLVCVFGAAVVRAIECAVERAVSR